MLRSIVTLLCLPMLAGATAALAQPAGMPMQPPRTITVSGSGSVSGTPDKAQVRLTVQKTNASMDKARTEVLAVVQRFLALTKKLGIPEGKVRSSSATRTACTASTARRACAQRAGGSQNAVACVTARLWWMAPRARPARS